MRAAAKVTSTMLSQCRRNISVCLRSTGAIGPNRALLMAGAVDRERRFHRGARDPLPAGELLRKGPRDGGRHHCVALLGEMNVLAEEKRRCRTRPATEWLEQVEKRHPVAPGPRLDLVVKVLVHLDRAVSHEAIARWHSHDNEARAIGSDTTIELEDQVLRELGQFRVLLDDAADLHLVLAPVLPGPIHTHCHHPDEPRYVQLPELREKPTAGRSLYGSGPAVGVTHGACHVGHVLADVVAEQKDEDMCGRPVADLARPLNEVDGGTVRTDAIV